MDKDFVQLMEEEVGEPDFPFTWDLMSEHLGGMDRGNLGIIFARPEVGKTTFCAFVAASYIKQKHKVVYWANEEPSEKIKLRIIQSFFGLTREEMKAGADALSHRYAEEIAPYLTVMDSVGTSMEELNEFAQLNEPDVMFCDQLDKFRVAGEFNRGDERLKETYVVAREVAKRNKLLIWSVSQASFEAHDRQFIDYAMLDGSRTGKAGEADVIIGIGKTSVFPRTNSMVGMVCSPATLMCSGGCITNECLDLRCGNNPQTQSQRFDNRPAVLRKLFGFKWLQVAWRTACPLPLLLPQCSRTT
jgi:archaellum biogenesis ATPase FlaH